jgi:hypothetical protein
MCSISPAVRASVAFSALRIQVNFTGNCSAPFSCVLSQLSFGDGTFASALFHLFFDGSHSAFTPVCSSSTLILNNSDTYSLKMLILLVHLSLARPGFLTVWFRMVAASALHRLPSNLISWTSIVQCHTAHPSEDV